MQIGYIYMLLALLSWGFLGVLYKLTATTQCRPKVINLSLYCYSYFFFLVGGTFTGKGSFSAPSFVVLLALFFGANSAVDTLAVQHALTIGKMSASWLAINMATGVATVASILIYHEPVNAWKILALVLMAAAMILLWNEIDAEEAGKASKPESVAAHEGYV